MASLPSLAGMPAFSVMMRSLKSTLPMSMPRGGMRTFSTRDLTTVAKAPPMMMPTAISMRLPLNAKSRNSLIMGLVKFGGI